MDFGDIVVHVEQTETPEGAKAFFSRAGRIVESAEAFNVRVGIETHGGLCNTGRDANGFRTFYSSQPDSVKAIPTFAIIFGEASPKALTDIATLTGGQAFDSRNVSLPSVFNVIRGYQ